MNLFNQHIELIGNICNCSFRNRDSLDFVMYIGLNQLQNQF